MQGEDEGKADGSHQQKGHCQDFMDAAVPPHAPAQTLSIPAAGSCSKVLRGWMPRPEVQGETQHTNMMWNQALFIADFRTSFIPFCFLYTRRVAISLVVVL